MIVRIMGEGQLDVDDARLRDLNELDIALERAVEGDDEDRFRTALSELLDAVRQAGTALPDDTLIDSDLILPPPDATVDDVRALLGDTGLIPDPL